MATKPVPKPELSHGSAIEYKAFARAFQGKGPAVLYLFATCYYPTGGYTIFFESKAGQEFDLLETRSQIVNELVTYYVADWTSSQPLVNPPIQVKIRDAHGVHTVPVKPWS